MRAPMRARRLEHRGEKMGARKCREEGKIFSK